MTEALPEDLLAQRLPDWYRAVSINIDGEHLATRRAMIEALAGDLDFESAEAAVAYAHGRKARGQQLIDALRTSAREHDPSFAADARDDEPQVMIAAALAHQLVTSPRSDLSIALGLLVLNAEFRGFKSAIKGQKLGQLAERQLQEAAAGKRAAASRTNPALAPAVAKKFSELAEFPEDEAGAVNSQVRLWATASKSATESVAKRVDLLEKTMLANYGVLEEELDQALWLLEERAHLAGAAWSELPKDAVPLLAAAELSLISKNPAPAALDVLLASTIYKAGNDPDAQVDLLKGVQRSQKFLSELPEPQVGELFPVGAALDAHREMQGRQSWRELAKSRRGGGNLKAASALEQSRQFARELFAARLLRP